MAQLIEAEVEVDIAQEVKSKGISVQKLLKQLYEKKNFILRLLI